MTKSGLPVYSKGGPFFILHHVRAHVRKVDVHQENKNHLRKLDINQGWEMTPTLNFGTL